MTTYNLLQLPAPTNLVGTPQNTSTGNLPGGTTYYIRVAATTVWFNLPAYIRPYQLKGSVESPVCSYITVTLGSSDNSIDLSWDATTPLTFPWDSSTSKISYYVFVTKDDPATAGQAAWDKSHLASTYNGSCGFTSCQNNSYTFEDESAICNYNLHFSERQFTLMDDIDPSYLGEQPMLCITAPTTHLYAQDLYDNLLGISTYTDGKTRFSTIAYVYLYNTASTTYTLILDSLSVHTFRSMIRSDGNIPISGYKSKFAANGYFSYTYNNGYKFNRTIINNWEDSFPVEAYLNNSSTHFYPIMDSMSNVIFNYTNFIAGYNTTQTKINTDSSIRMWFHSGTIDISDTTMARIYFDTGHSASYYSIDMRTRVKLESLELYDTWNFAAYNRAATLGCATQDCIDEALSINLLIIKDSYFYNSTGTLHIVDGEENVPTMVVYSSYAEAKYWHIALINTVSFYVKDKNGNPVQNATAEIIDTDGKVYSGVTDADGYVKLEPIKLLTTKYDYATDALGVQHNLLKYPFTVRVYKQGYNLFEMTNYKPDVKASLPVVLGEEIGGTNAL